MMVDKLTTLGPEIVLLVGAVACLISGLSSSWLARSTTRVIALVALLIASLAAWGDACAAADLDQAQAAGNGFANYTKITIASIGILLLMLFGKVSSTLDNTSDNTTANAGYGATAFDPGTTIRGEFIAFFLFSLTGAMLCAGAQDLVWLFLALELTSLPTYVMAATANNRQQAQEAAVKYFFLGALAAGVFLYGFALIYGATGATDYHTITAYISQASSATTADAGNTYLFVTGLVLAIVGISFKIAAAPMHFYAADVYEGVATPVTAFLAFVPKTAGFVSLIGLLGLAAPLNEDQRLPIICTFWLMAAVTMTIGNVMALLQKNVKRVLAYSSIAHSGYMLVGLLVIPAGYLLSPNTPAVAIGNGSAAILFYLVAYALATLGVFGVMICLERDGQEIQTYNDLSGLARRNPTLGAIMLICLLSLLGLPPMVGFIGKIYLFGSAIDQGYIGLVVIAVLNSAISAVYYLRIASACFFGDPNTQVQWSGTPAARLSAAIAAASALCLGISGNWLVDAANNASSDNQNSQLQVVHISIETPPEADADIYETLETFD